MSPFKLRTKIILFTVCLVFALVSSSFLLINQVVKRKVRARLVVDLERSQHALEQNQKDLLRQMIAYSVIAAENSTLKAAIETYQTEQGNRIPIARQLKRTVENEAAKLFSILTADLLVVTDNSGEVLAMDGVTLPSEDFRLNLAAEPSIMNCLSQAPVAFEQAAGIWEFQKKTFRIVSVPILLQDIVVGTLSSGFEISPGFVQSIKANTNTDVVFVANGRIIASTLSPTENALLLDKPGLQAVSERKDSLPVQSEMVLGEETYLTLRFGDTKGAKNFFFILNSIDRNMRETMDPIKGSLILVGVVSILIAALFGLALSQSITKPLMNFVNFMGEITRTEELQQSFTPQKPNFEVDVLARSFESMARSLAESQAQSARYHEELRIKEFNEEKLRGLAIRSHLDALISQINPHFLFNALNTVGVLIDENPEEARRLTVKLANIFRKTLQASEREFVSCGRNSSLSRIIWKLKRPALGIVSEWYRKSKYKMSKSPALRFSPSSKMPSNTERPPNRNDDHSHFRSASRKPSERPGLRRWDWDAALSGGQHV
ncbi:MAG: histidine kinase [Terriglobia bacterium]